jgi:hypothetical protein
MEVCPVAALTPKANPPKASGLETPACGGAGCQSAQRVLR